MPTIPMRLDWGERTVEVSNDGSARLLSSTGVVVRLSMDSLSVDSAQLTGPDEIEFGVLCSGLPGSQRHSVAEHWRLRWVLHNPGLSEQEVRLPLRIEPGEGWSGWCWAGGAHGIIVLSHPAHPDVVALVLDQGQLWPTPAAPPATSWDELVSPPRVLQAAEPGIQLPPGGRYVVSFTARVLSGLGAAAGLLPAWARDTVLTAGEPWSAPLADAGVTLASSLRSWLDADRLQVIGPPGRHLVRVHHPRGITVVPLEWAPEEDRALADWVETALESGAQFSPADAFCIQVAADRGLLRPDPEVEDRLDRLDWRQEDDPFAVSFKVARGLAQSEPVVVWEALDRLAAIPVSRGYGRTLIRAWLAAVTLSLDAEARCLALLDRPALDALAGVECALLHYRDPESSGAILAGLVRQSGGDLPGDPLVDSWADQAAVAGVLRLCPEGWPEASDSAVAALRIRRRVLAAYADGRIAESGPMAWLLLDVG